MKKKEQGTEKVKEKGDLRMRQVRRGENRERRPVVEKLEKEERRG